MRVTAFIFPLLACGAAGYFAYHLQIGDHGLKARADLEHRLPIEAVAHTATLVRVAEGDTRTLAEFPFGTTAA